MNSNFVKRAVTGVIFVAVLVGAICGGPVSFTILFSLITALTIWEFGTIVERTLSWESRIYQLCAEE